ncbi:MAG: hypothetical protein J6Z01_15985 [Bacteroidales bacterium]|nr:hypothetical protein [Bacteroidales bacterium]
MVKKLSTIKTTSIIILLVVFALSTSAQSKHASICQIGNYCLDFKTNPPTFYPFDYRNYNNTNLNSMIWYVDNEGEVSIIINTNSGEIAFLDKASNQFHATTQQLSYGFFVPMPEDESQVFYIEQNRYYLIDITRESIELKGDDIDISWQDYIAVQHTDCDKLWIINPGKTVWTTYLLTKEGITKVKETNLNATDYNSFPQTYNWQLILSKDCQHYSLINYDHYQTEVYYGDFDRSTGEFTRKSRYDFGTDYININNSIIAPDNSRIYYIRSFSTYDLEIIEVPIVDGKPDYNTQTKIYEEKKFGALGARDMFYGIDNNIYIIDHTVQKINTININEQNETVFTDSKYNMTKKWDVIIHNHFISSWYLDNPCTKVEYNNICASIPTTYSVESPEPGYTYHWQITGGTLNNTTGQSTTATWDETEGIGTLSVYAEDQSTGCKSEITEYRVQRHKSPSATFDNAQVCYGEPLNISLSGTAPYEIYYNINGEGKSISTSESEYTMSNIPGKYTISKVKDKYCETEPNQNNTSEILPKLNKLTIKANNN